MLGGLLDSGHPRDESTDAAARVLMKFQQEDGSWSFAIAREPMESSDFATTALAARVLKGYMPSDCIDQVGQSLAKARRWLMEYRPETNDDLAFRLLGLKWTGAPAEEISSAAEALRARQRSDGGWGQIDSSKASDAYAMGLSLLALPRGGGVPVGDPAYRRGVEFLLSTQRPNGTWYVRKRSHEYNPYFDAGFPHGKNQFISLSATCYAMMALSLAAEPPGVAGR
jgi:hypothetical protein